MCKNANGQIMPVVSTIKLNFLIEGVKFTHTYSMPRDQVERTVPIDSAFRVFPASAEFTCFNKEYQCFQGRGPFFATQGKHGFCVFHNGFHSFPGKRKIPTAGYVLVTVLAVISL